MATKSTVKKTTTRKPAAKKPAATKKPVAKKTVAAKASTKRPAVKRAASKKSKKDEFKSFHIARTDSPFLTIAITRQTIYWLIIAAAVLALGLWTIHLQNEVNSIYDQFEAASAVVIE